MKNLVLALLMLFSTQSYSQFELGVKLGLSSIDLDQKILSIPSDDNTIELSFAESNYGFHFGLYSRISIANIYLEPSFLFNSSTVSYNVKEEIFDTGVIDNIKSETYNNLDIPLMVGMKMGFFRFHAGPVAHIYINSTSELTSIDGYSQKLKDATYGIQGGIGLDILKIRLELNYETNLSKFGGDISVGGNSYNFDDRPSRLIASVGIRF